MEQVPAADIDKVFAHTTNLASCNLNSKVLACSDEYFASAENLLTPTPAISRPGVFVHTGAWYDGWETRRHNPEPYDWVVIKLGVAAGAIQGVEVDTAHFKGNYGEKAELWATHAPGVADEQITDPSYTGWTTVLPPSSCGPSQRQAWKIPYDAAHPVPYTHVRLHMYPDGGFARLRLYGHAIPPPPPAIQNNQAPIEEQFVSQRAAHNQELYKAGGSPTNDEVRASLQVKPLRGAKGKTVFKQLKNKIPANGFSEATVALHSPYPERAASLKANLQDLLAQA